MQDGRTTEIISVGREGMVGLPSVMGLTRKRFRATVTVPGSAWRIPAEAIAETFRREGRLGVVLRRYAQARLFQVSQLTACNLLHTVEQRLSRWLLMARDQLGSRPIPVTHEMIADLLGAQRSTISTTASNLERSGMITYKRGQITIADRPRLLASACECYESVRQRLAETVAA
jgi:CRP-like cAMP-binding protein